MAAPRHRFGAHDRNALFTAQADECGKRVAEFLGLQVIDKAAEGFVSPAGVRGILAVQLMKSMRIPPRRATLRRRSRIRTFGPALRDRALNRCNHLISHRRKGRPVLVPRREPHGFPVILDRDQKFESSFLQRRVRVSYSPGRCRSRTRWFRAGVRRSVGGAVGRRRAGRSKIAPKNRNISVGPYSSITLQSLRGKGIASLSRACTAKVRLAKDPYAEGAPGRLGACWA